MATTIVSFAKGRVPRAHYLLKMARRTKYCNERQLTQQRREKLLLAFRQAPILKSMRQNTSCRHRRQHRHTVFYERRLDRLARWAHHTSLLALASVLPRAQRQLAHATGAAAVLQQQEIALIQHALSQPTAAQQHAAQADAYHLSAFRKAIAALDGPGSRRLWQRKCQQWGHSLPRRRMGARALLQHEIQLLEEKLALADEELMEDEEEELDDTAALSDGESVYLATLRAAVQRMTASERQRLLQVKQQACEHSLRVPRLVQHEIRYLTSLVIV